MSYPLPQPLVELISERFRVLAEPMRIRILERLRDGESPVQALTEALATSQQNVSKHLAVLGHTGIVGRRKDGNFAYYRVIDTAVFDLCEQVFPSRAHRERRCGSMNARGDPIEILLVEDNPGDVALTEHALNTAEIHNRLTVAACGADALTHLRTVPDGAAGRPHLILLDLSLPDMSGFDLLASLKADSRLRRIPVVVITSSDTDADVVRSYELRACGYVTKPLDPADYVRTVGGVGHYWHRIARLPPI